MASPQYIERFPVVMRGVELWPYIRAADMRADDDSTACDAENMRRFTINRRSERALNEIMRVVGYSTDFTMWAPLPLAPIDPPRIAPATHARVAALRHEVAEAQRRAEFFDTM